ncbi:MAG TPA: UvrD-helicase domain-containing protein, partial [Candidatus Onthousia faecigallinarum]|nr:UvrD-helicase domain-containing protein [Candidatus Onthousia faecigallinarum]
MPKFTEEQQQAIDREGENILVSAGAGSGKTAVLTERVLRKIKEGISIKQLLILTFTNKAAMEMKERIRKKLAKEHLQDQLDQIDSSYITTFDAFSLAIVKKYSDVLGVSKQVKIMEESILRLKKKEILEEIFDAYYQNPTPSFEHLIYYFCFKGDDSLKEKILSLNEKLDLIIEKEEYLKDYLDTYYNEKIVEERVEEYLALIQTKKEALYECYQDFTSLLEGKYLSKILVLFEPLWNNKSYEEMKSHLDFSLPRLPAGMGEEGKQAKE